MLVDTRKRDKFLTERIAVQREEKCPKTKTQELNTLSAQQNPQAVEAAQAQAKEALWDCQKEEVSPPPLPCAAPQHCQAVQLEAI